MRIRIKQLINGFLAGLSLIIILAACGNNSNSTGQTVVSNSTAIVTTINNTTVANTSISTTPVPENTATVAATPQPTTVEATIAATATPQATPTATTVPPTLVTIPDNGIIPARLRIPTIGVDAKVELVGKTSSGAMDVPKNVFDVAWFDQGVKPGNSGNAVIDGHLDGYNLPAAVFINLDKLQTGNKIYVSDGNGKELTFEVYGKQTYNYNSAPLDKIFGSAFEPHLNLITCQGNWDSQKQNYSERLVIFTKLVKS